MDTEFVASAANPPFDTNFVSAGYHCHIALIPEHDGTWSAVVLNLPGAGSCGDTEQEVLENVRKAVSELIASYAEDHLTIPWRDASPEEVPKGAKEVWILVDGGSTTGRESPAHDAELMAELDAWEAASDEALAGFEDSLAE